MFLTWMQKIVRIILLFHLIVKYENTTNKMKVLFNTEGNKSIGMGAFYDCTILAEKLRERFNAKIKFLISHDSEKDVKGALLNGYDVERVDMRDTEIFFNSVKEFKPDIIVQNLLNLKEDYMEGLNKLKVKIVDISHKMDFKDHLKADIVISLLYDSTDMKCLYGPRYAILDNKFGDLKKRETKGTANKLLISFGGSDVNNLTFKLIKVLDKIDISFHVNVVIGPGFGDEDVIDENLNSLTNKKRFIINKKVTDMVSLILGSDLAFVSGGRTICELAAAGTPGIVFAQNELEYCRLKEFEKWGSVLNYGYFMDNDKNLSSDIENVVLNKALREELSRKGRELVDGNGVDRIIDAIVEHNGKAA